MAHSFIQVPPDSTGKKVRHTQLIDMEVINVNIIFEELAIDEVVTGLTSGATGLFHGSKHHFGETYIFVHPKTGTFEVGETIQLGDDGFADIDSFVFQQTPNVHIVDADSPLNTQSIGNNGAAHIRFDEGNQLFDSWGRTQTSVVSIMGSFNFIYQDPGPRSFYDKTLDGGLVTPTISTSTLTLSTTTASGSFASRSTHQYYPYVPGEGNEWRAFMQVGDVGKENQVKRWGIFDDDNGMFFEQAGVNQRVVIRSSVSGTPVDTRVERLDFNGERLDNEGDSFLLDPTKFNLFWIDYAGVAKVRFGVFSPSGDRVILHTFKDLNTYVLPPLKTSTLPIKFEMENLDIVTSSSEMKLASTSISRQSPIQDYFGKTYSTLSPRTVVSGSSVPIMAVRPKLTQGGFTNRITFQPQDLEWIVEGDPCVIEVKIGGVLTGSVFVDNSDPGSAAQIDTSSTSIIGGGVFEKLLANGSENVRELANDLSLSISLNGDGSTTELALTARTLDPLGSANVTLILRWREIH
jgi:hypothetical protein